MKSLKLAIIFLTFMTQVNTSFAQVNTPSFDPALVPEKTLEVVKVYLKRHHTNDVRIYESDIHQGKYKNNSFSEFFVKIEAVSDVRGDHYSCEGSISIRIEPFRKRSGEIIFESVTNHYQIIGDVRSFSCH